MMSQRPSAAWRSFVSKLVMWKVSGPTWSQAMQSRCGIAKPVATNGKDSLATFATASPSSGRQDAPANGCVMASPTHTHTHKPKRLWHIGGRSKTAPRNERSRADGVDATARCNARGDASPYCCEGDGTSQAASCLAEQKQSRSAVRRHKAGPGRSTYRPNASPRFGDQPTDETALRPEHSAARNNRIAPWLLARLKYAMGANAAIVGRKQPRMHRPPRTMSDVEKSHGPYIRSKNTCVAKSPRRYHRELDGGKGDMATPTQSLPGVASHAFPPP